MPLIRRLRIPALFCAFAVLVCELVSRPYTTMGISDDGPYILMARTLADTGHIVYNGWAAAMLLAQLYLGAAFIKLFGFSFTTVRMSTLLVAIVLAWLLQRTLVRSGITERNATLGTLALVLSPLYLMLSPTFMSDITGLFAIVICLYGCLRALQSSTDRSAIAWLGCAVLANVLCGTSRQIAWLGTLVMVPSTLWLLRARRRVLIAGAALTLFAALFILACMHWLKLQPYSIPVPLLVPNFPLTHALGQLCYLLLDIPFLLLPVFALFLPEIRGSRPRVIVLLSTVFLAYLVVAILTRHHQPILRLEPICRSPGSWVGTRGVWEGMALPGLPFFLHAGTQTLLTIASLGGLLGFIALIFRARPAQPPLESIPGVSWKQLKILFFPFTSVYALLLLSCAGTTYYLYDRYALGLLPLFLIWFVRYYQEQVNIRLPLFSICLICIMAIYGITVTHNTFAVDRARVALAGELHANGVPDTSIDGGWEYNFDVELQHADHINEPLIQIPADGYVLIPPLPARTCPMFRYDYTPHIHPLFGISFDPNACYGPAPFAPMHYSRWPFRTPGTLYVVRSTPPANP